MGVDGVNLIHPNVSSRGVFPGIQSLTSDSRGFNARNPEPRSSEPLPTESRTNTFGLRTKSAGPAVHTAVNAGSTRADDPAPSAGFGNANLKPNGLPIRRLTLLACQICQRLLPNPLNRSGDGSFGNTITLVSVRVLWKGQRALVKTE